MIRWETKIRIYNSHQITSPSTADYEMVQLRPDPK